jgi:hypothetical protein
MSVCLPPILSVFLLCLSVCLSVFLCHKSTSILCMPVWCLCLLPTFNVFLSVSYFCLSVSYVCLFVDNILHIHLPAKYLSFCFICHMSYVCLSALHPFFRPNIYISLSDMTVSLPPTSVCLLPMSAFYASLLACFVCLFAHYSSTAV